jgi:serine/threonine protein kinase/WD40 repeat protein
MALSSGTRLGPYEVLAPLGAGGMGEVYRARDTRLGREAALKVLPEIFAKDAERMARFEREAQVLASLNYPNIATLYGLEESGDTRALAMELVEGPTLAERIAAGAIPVEEAVPIAKQIAEALEYAHEKGIIHRDLKPANVKITPEGVVKVLDFGLAKALDDAPAAGSINNSPTMSLAATRLGVILGTAGYMSPEQASGKPADKRSDIWSFGVLLWEMLAGKRLFDGESVSHTLADVLRAEIDWKPLPAATPTVIRDLLRRCLDRDGKARLRDIGEARIAIQKYLANPAGALLSMDSGPSTAPPSPRLRTAWAIATLAALALAVVHFREASPEPVAVRFQIPEPEKAHFGSRLALSPDGRRLAFTAAATGGRTQVWVRSLDTLESRALPGTDGDDLAALFWSPDSRFIGFWASGKLKKIEASGGPPQTLCDVSTTPGGTWNRDGVILFGSNAGGLSRVPAAGGTPAPVTTLDTSRQEVFHTWPQFLPDGRHFIYIARSNQPENSAIYAGSLDSKDRKRLVGSSFSAAYAPSPSPDKGHLLFLREATLMAQPFDAARLELSGEAFPVAEQVGAVLSQSFFSVSGNGVVAYRSGVSGRATHLLWFNRDGKSLGEVGPPGAYNDVALSSDGTRVAVSRADLQTTNPDIWLLDLARDGAATRFTFDPGIERDPVWSPDGTRLAFSSTRGGLSNVYQKLGTGAGSEEPLLQPGVSQRPKDWSHDGRFLLYVRDDPKTEADLWVLPLAGDRKPFPYLQTQFLES